VLARKATLVRVRPQRDFRTPSSFKGDAFPRGSLIDDDGVGAKRRRNLLKFRGCPLPGSVERFSRRFDSTVSGTNAKKLNAAVGYAIGKNSDGKFARGENKDTRRRSAGNYCADYGRQCE